MIEWMDPDLKPQFPPTELALQEPNGLLAAGGRLSPAWLLTAYQQGIFPWFDPDEVCLWWTPAPRTIITPDSLRLSRTNSKLLRKMQGTITHNLAFESVIHACAAPREQQAGTWISEEMIEAYVRMHHAGYAHSIEHWSDDGKLIGGYYGLLIGSVFFGESMFSRESNASKIAFAISAPIWFEHGLKMIDCQMNTDHLSQFGSQDVSRSDFEELLHQSLELNLEPLPSLL